jgi:hypothetical protein
VLTTLAVFTPDGGFSAQRGQSAALASLRALTSIDLTRFVPSVAVDGQRVLFVGWTAAAIGIAVLVRCSAGTGSVETAPSARAGCGGSPADPDTAPAPPGRRATGRRLTGPDPD